MRGELSGTKIRRIAQECIIGVMQELKELTIADGCKVLCLQRRRYYRWLKVKPVVVKRAWNRIMAKEEAAIVTVGRDEKLADLRAAGLMVYGHESGQFHCSISTIQRVLKRNDLQAEYVVPTRKRPEKPDIRQLMTEPKRVFSYDATDFYLTNRLRVVVIPILDLGSRKFIHYGVRVTSFRQQDVMDIWDEALWKEGIDTSQLTALSDRGGQMKGSRTKAHLIDKWDIRLEFARPYTPDDNAWIESLIKYMKYHPACPDRFDTVQDVMDWIATFHNLYNDHPHSSLGYVRPNEEHAGLGNAIRQARKDNLSSARQMRLAFYKLQKEVVSDYAADKDLVLDRLLSENLEAESVGIEENSKNGILPGNFRHNSSAVLCQNR